MGWTESAERRSRKNDFGYWLSWAAREIGICRAVKVHGWLDALPPTFTRGVPKVAHTGGGGSSSPAYLSQIRVKNRAVNTERSVI